MAMDERKQIDLTPYGYPEEYKKPVNRIVDLELDLLQQELQKDPPALTTEVVTVLGRLEIAYALGLNSAEAIDKWVTGEARPDEVSIVRLAICANFIDRMRRENYPPHGSPINTRGLFRGMKGNFGDLSMMEAMRVVEPADLVHLQREFNVCQIHELIDAHASNDMVSEELWKYFGNPDDPKVKRKLSTP